MDPTQHRVEIVTLHPMMIIGATLIAERSSSPEAFAKIMNRDMPGVPEISVPAVDVRDVALAHIRALCTENLHGLRIILHQECLSFVRVADTLHAEFGKYGYRVQTRRLGYCPLKLASIFDDQVKIILPMFG